ncbi:MAG: hypothetical protein KIT16_05395 [Rhodospirillaceae bacterium]|nr:hypothetical protein [Rhodospirillaceae bacterium]
MAARRMLAAGLIACAALSGGTAQAQSSRSVTFDFMKAGAVPRAFACDTTGPGGPGRWVVTQAMAEGGIRKVFAQTSQVAGQDRMPHCLLKGYRRADVDVVVLIRPVSGDHAQAGGLIWHAADKQNFYALLMDAKADRMAVYRIEKGHPAPLPIAGGRGRYDYPFKIQRDRWYQLRVRVTGRRFEIFLDNTKRFEVEDDELAGAGAVGLVTMSDSVIQFDAFNVTRSQ